MAVMIENRWRALLTVELNSGDSLHLAPGEAAGPVEDFETVGNARVASLAERGLIAVRPAAAERAASRRTARPAAATAKKGRAKRGRTAGARPRRRAAGPGPSAPA